MKPDQSIYEVKYDFENVSPWKNQPRVWDNLVPDEIPKTIHYPEIPLHDLGREAASGIYFVRMQAEGFSQVRKMMLLK